jgi:hypothetical protein
MQNLTKCNECDAVFDPATFLRAMSPFDSHDELLGCPSCRQCTDGFTRICDADRCRNTVTCGWPSKDGYRQTCYEHAN